MIRPLTLLLLMGIIAAPSMAAEKTLNFLLHMGSLVEVPETRTRRVLTPSGEAYTLTQTNCKPVHMMDSNEQSDAQIVAIKFNEGNNLPWSEGSWRGKFLVSSGPIREQVYLVEVHAELAQSPGDLYLKVEFTLKTPQGDVLNTSSLLSTVDPATTQLSLDNFGDDLLTANVEQGPVRSQQMCSNSGVFLALSGPVR